MDPLFEDDQADTDDVRFTSDLREWLVAVVFESDPDQAVTLSLQSIEPITELVASDPENLLLQHELAFKRHNLAKLYANRGDTSLAIEQLKKIAIIRIELAKHETILASQQYRELIFIMASLADLDPENAHTHWSSANIYASTLYKADMLDDADLWTLEETARKMKAAAPDENRIE